MIIYDLLPIDFVFNLLKINNDLKVLLYIIL